MNKVLPIVLICVSSSIVWSDDAPDGNAPTIFVTGGYGKSNKIPGVAAYDAEGNELWRRGTFPDWPEWALPLASGKTILVWDCYEKTELLDKRGKTIRLLKLDVDLQHMYCPMEDRPGELLAIGNTKTKLDDKRPRQWWLIRTRCDFENGEIKQVKKTPLVQHKFKGDSWYLFETPDRDLYSYLDGSGVVQLPGKVKDWERRGFAEFHGLLPLGMDRWIVIDRDLDLKCIDRDGTELWKQEKIGNDEFVAIAVDDSYRIYAVGRYNVFIFDQQGRLKKSFRAGSYLGGYAQRIYLVSNNRKKDGGSNEGHEEPTQLDESCVKLQVSLMK